MDAWSVAFSPDSKHIATGSHHGKVNIFGVESGKKEYSLDTRGKFILSIAYVRSHTFSLWPASCDLQSVKLWPHPSLLCYVFLRFALELIISDSSNVSQRALMSFLVNWWKMLSSMSLLIAALLPRALMESIWPAERLMESSIFSTSPLENFSTRWKVNWTRFCIYASLWLFLFEVWWEFSVLVKTTAETP